MSSAKQKTVTLYYFLHFLSALITNISSAFPLQNADFLVSSSGWDCVHFTIPGVRQWLKEGDIVWETLEKLSYMLFRKKVPPMLYKGGWIFFWVNPRLSIRIGLVITGKAIKSVALPFSLRVNSISWGFAIICVWKTLCLRN